MRSRVDRSWQSGRSARAAVAGLLVLVLAGQAGCRGTTASELELQLTRQLTAQLGPVTSVRCPGTPAPQQCEVTVPGEVRVPIRVVAEAGQLRWRLDGLVISAQRLEQHLTEQLAAIGVTAAPRCGAPLQLVTSGQRLSCQLPSLGLAWATIRADGSYSIEIALGEAVAARTEVVDEVQLDALSRALDREQGAGDDDEEDDASSDGSAGRAGAGEAL